MVFNIRTQRQCSPAARVSKEPERLNEPDHDQAAVSPARSAVGVQRVVGRPLLDLEFSISEIAPMLIEVFANF